MQSLSRSSRRAANNLAPGSQSSSGSTGFLRTLATAALGTALAVTAGSLATAHPHSSTTREFYFYSGKASQEEDEEDDFLLFSGSSNPELAHEVAKYLGRELSPMSAGHFADGETSVTLGRSVRGRNVFLIQGTGPPVNENLTELFLLISAMRRGAADRITVVIPYYGYARQDRKVASAEVPLSAAEVARMLETAGVDEVVCVDLHNSQIQGFFSPRVPCVNLSALPVGAAWMSELSLASPVVVAPSPGSLHNARNFRDSLASLGSIAGLAIVVPKRAAGGAGSPHSTSGTPQPQQALATAASGEDTAATNTRGVTVAKADGASAVSMMASGEASVMAAQLVGSVNGSDVILADDICDTAATITAAARLLKREGARRVFAFATHGVFSAAALERIANTPELTQVIVTNTLPTVAAHSSDEPEEAAASGAPEESHRPRDVQVDSPKSTKHDRIVRINIAPLLAEAIKRIHRNDTISGIYRDVV